MERDNDLVKEKKDIQDVIKNAVSLSNLTSQIRNRNIIILLGQTRGGKSTLANYLLGYKLTSVKAIGNMYKLEMLDTEQGPQIIKGPVSGTSIPKVYTMPDGCILIDSPGFEDTHGISQNIFNAICINHIGYAKSVKFVLVCDINDIINDSVRNFTNLFEQMADLVVNLQEIKNSVCIIFTKDRNDITLDELRGVMKNDILNETELEGEKRLLPTLTKNTKLIGNFKAPTRQGKINLGELDVNVKNAINACSYVNVKNLKIEFPLDDKSKIFLKKVYPHYTESTYFKSEIERTMEYIINYFDIEKYVYASYQEELSVVQNKLLKPFGEKLKLLLKKKINNLNDLKVALEALMKIRKLKLSSEFTSDFEFILLLDNASLLEERVRKLIIRNYNASTSELLDKIQRVIDKIHAEYQLRKDENIILLYEANNSRDGFNTFSVGFQVAKAKLTNAVTSSEGVSTVGALNTAATIATDLTTSGVATIAGATTTGTAAAGGATIAGAATAGVATAGTATGAAAAGVAAAGGATIARAATVGVATVGVATAGTAATAGVATAGTVAAGGATIAGAATTGTAAAGGATIAGAATAGIATAGTAAGAATAGVATAGTAATGGATIAGAATTVAVGVEGATIAGAAGTVTTGAVTAGGMGALGLGAVAGGAGILVAGAVGTSSVYWSVQEYLVKRSESRRRQNRGLDNDNYILDNTHFITTL